MFYSDHGSAGVLGMPYGPFLYADQLIGALERKQAAQGFQEIVMYVEACEAGSMFQGPSASTSGMAACKSPACSPPSAPHP